jgi:hypothetical protein
MGDRLKEGANRWSALHYATTSGPGSKTFCLGAVENRLDEQSIIFRRAAHLSETSRYKAYMMTDATIVPLINTAPVRKKMARKRSAHRAEG